MVAQRSPESERRVVTATRIVPVTQRTPAWLEFRQDKITATDAAIIAGEKGSVVELWAQKSGLMDPPEFDQATRDLMDEGLAIQPYLLDYYRRKTAKRVRAIHTMRQRKDWPVAVSSPDGEVMGEPVGIEAKMATSARWTRLEDDPVPGDVYAQVQWQAYTAGWQSVDVVVLLFGRPKIIPVPADPAYIDNLVWLARQFHGWVRDGIRPEVDGSDGTRRALAAIHPRNDGTIIASTPDLDAIATGLRDAKANTKTAASEEAALENALRALIGDADGIRGSWGKVTWTRNAESERTDWKLLADAYESCLTDALDDHGDNWESVRAKLREHVAVLRGLYTRVVDGPRVLRCSFRGE